MADMTLAQFKRGLVAAFGKGWLVPAGQDLGVGASKLQRITNGTYPLYPETAEKLKRFMKVRRGEITSLLKELGEE